MRSPEGETHGSARVNCSYRNRLVERTTTDGKTIRITYDGDGHRVREAVTENGLITTTEFLVDSRNPTGYAQVLEERVQGTVTTVHTYGHDLISQDVRQPGGAFAASFYTYDGHGSVRQLTDALGQVTDAYTYDAFGVLLDSHGATTNRYLYAGEQFVPSLGLYYNRARYLNATNGRFWTMDAYEGRGMEPATLHKYLYAHGDPVNGVDPSGMLVSPQETTVATSILGNLQTKVLIGFSVVGAFKQLDHHLTEWVIAEFKKLDPHMQARKEGLLREVMRKSHDNAPPDVLRRLRSRKRRVFLDYLHKWHEVVVHDASVQARRPFLITLHVGPRGTGELWERFKKLNRDRALKGQPKGYGNFNLDWHEYPFASTLEGGLQAEAALVRNTKNRSQGFALQKFFSKNKMLLGDGFDVIIIW